MNRTLLATIVALFVVSCASQPSKDATPQQAAGSSSYTSQAGEIPVGVIPQGAIRDARRNRDLEVNIEYPTRGGPHPIIIFSHAYGLSGRTSYVGLSSYWASHGYVVIKPTHRDAGKLTPEELRDPEKVIAPMTPEDWRNRAEDMRLVLDSLEVLAQQYPELQGKMDAARVVVGGHSYGAITAVMVAGTPSVKAVLAMSPQGENSGLTSESWSALRIPVMVMTGTNDSDPLEMLSPGDKWLISIVGASHFTFAGVYRPPPTERERPGVIDPMPRTNPREPVREDPARRSVPMSGRNWIVQDRNTFNLIKAASRAFFDTYLKTDTKGREYLTGLSTRQDLTITTK